MKDSFLSLLGFCAKAGKLSAGEDAVTAAVRGGKAKLVLVVDSASANTKKKLRDACAHHGVPLIEAGEELLAASGKHGRKAMAVLDEGFAKSLLEQHESP